MKSEESKITAQCGVCKRVFYGEKWLFGRMSINLPHVAVVDCPDCAAKSAGVKS